MNYDLGLGYSLQANLYIVILFRLRHQWKAEAKESTSSGALWKWTQEGETELENVEVQK